MSNQQSGKWQFALAGLFVAAFVLNVTLRILFIKHNIALWHFGDVGEFLLVLVAMAFFVSGLLVSEEMPESSVLPAQNNYQGEDK